MHLMEKPKQEFEQAFTATFNRLFLSFYPELHYVPSTKLCVDIRYDLYECLL